MKKFFADAEMEIVKFSNEDVIATSGDVDMSDIEKPDFSDIDDEI